MLVCRIYTKFVSAYQAGGVEIYVHSRFSTAWACWVFKKNIQEIEFSSERESFAVLGPKFKQNRVRYVQGGWGLDLQHNEEDDEAHLSESDDRSKEAPWARDNPLQRRLVGGREHVSSSESEESLKLHSMGGKAMDSSTSWETSTNALMSNEAMSERDRFKFFVQIMGLSLLITGLVTFCKSSRASVAEEKDLFMVERHMLSCKS